MGISLRDLAADDINVLADKIYDKVTRRAEKLVATGEQIERELGIPIINKRISVTPIAMVGATSSANSYVPLAKALDRAADTTGVNFVGGFSALVQKGFAKGDEILINSIPEALGQYIAGMGFSNVGLGIVHSMAHPLGAVYDTPHGVANAIILPTVMAYNAPATGEKYRDIAKAMGVKGVDDMTLDQARAAAVDAVKQLSQDVGIPADLKDIVKPEDVDFLAQSAYDDACRPGNPRDTSVEEIKQLYLSLM